MLLSINPRHPEPKKVSRAVQALANGEIIAYPTDTAYGLGCDLMNKKAIEKLYELKRLKPDHLLTFLCHNLQSLSRFATFEKNVYRILRRFLPGPYCFVLEATREVPKLVQSKRKTVGIRIPNHPVTLAMVGELDRPILSTTAARGPEEEPFIDPHEINAHFRTLALVLDGGVGGKIPSSIVDLTQDPPQVLREGVGSVAEFL